MVTTIASLLQEEAQEGHCWDLHQARSERVRCTKKLGSTEVLELHSLALRTQQMWVGVHVVGDEDRRDLDLHIQLN